MNDKKEDYYSFNLNKIKIFDISLWLGRFSCGGLLLPISLVVIIISLFTTASFSLMVNSFFIFPILSMVFSSYLFLKEKKKKTKPNINIIKGWFLSVFGILFIVLGVKFGYIYSLRYTPFTFLLLSLGLNIIVELIIVKMYYKVNIKKKSNKKLKNFMLDVLFALGGFGVTFVIIMFTLLFNITLNYYAQIIILFLIWGIISYFRQYAGLYYAILNLNIIFIVISIIGIILNLNKKLKDRKLKLKNKRRKGK